MDLSTHQACGLKVNLIGHSFGGIVAALFAEKYLEKVNSIILVSAPVSLQETFRTIISESKDIYKKKKDSENLEYIEELPKMDTTSIEYSSRKWFSQQRMCCISP